MGILRARVGGQWVDIGTSPGVPVGGTTGQVLTKTTGTDYDASWQNVPRGVMGYGQITGSSAAITAITDVGSMFVTWTASPARRYRTSVNAIWSGTVAGDLLLAHITDGSGVVKFSQHRNVGVAGYDHISMSVVESGLSGSVQRKLQHQRYSGTGTSQVVASATAPGYILVEDIGPI